MDTASLPGSRDQRAAVRFDTHLPVEIDGLQGQAQNVSAQGIYFETDVRQELGALVNFTVEFTLHGRRHRLLCEGKVVRVEDHGNRVGVAARLLAPFFEEENAP
jgi:hypothetical protein